MIATVERQDATRTDIPTTTNGTINIPQSIREPPKLNRKQRRAIEAKNKRRLKTMKKTGLDIGR